MGTSSKSVSSTQVIVATLTSIVILVKELFEPIKGTDQSVVDLMRSNWGYLEIRHYFSEPLSNLLLLGFLGVVVVHAIVKHLKTKFRR